MEKFKFENLNVYQESLLFIDSIYTLTNAWPSEERFGLISQIRRAATSIALNIAEGTSRTKRDFRHFLDLSKGSCYECVAVLTIAKTRKYVTAVEYARLYEALNKLVRMLSKLKSSITLD